jgi:predicted amidohydrolase YtcJ
MVTIRTSTWSVVAAVCGALTTPVSPVRAQDADLIVRNARIWTGDSTRPRAEALAVRGERLIAVGTNAQADAHRGSRTRVIDAGGRFMTPGFIDDHTHFAQAGALLIGANLLDVHTAGPFAQRVKAAVQRMSPGAWLTGGDWGSVRGQPGQQHRRRCQSPDDEILPGSVDHRLGDA